MFSITLANISAIVVKLKKNKDYYDTTVFEPTICLEAKKDGL